jgi:glucose-1-phosphate adenylyltransferase
MKVLAMVLAGGQGSRLHPLTAERSKPAVPFGSRYRIADFVLSNLVNSEIRSIYLLVQYKSQSMIEHVNKAWGHSHSFPGEFVTVVPPQMREGQEWFQGTADAIFQNINLIERHAPEMVAVFGADHIYRMDVRQMVDAHKARDAHVSVAAIPVPLEIASGFGIVDCAPDGRIVGFLEKPAHPPAMPGDPTRAFGSMGNYLFDTDVLLQALREAKQRGETDFGSHILPRLIHSHKVHAYNFADNSIPGIRDYEEPGYWRDVGTLDAYYAANQDVLGDTPRFNLYNPQWFINSSNYQGPSPRIVSGQIEDSVVGAGSLIRGARLKNTILRREVIIEPDVEIEDSIIMDYAVIRRGARLRRVVVDRYNEVAAGTMIGFDADADQERYVVSPEGVVVLPKGPDRPDISRYEI